MRNYDYFCDFAALENLMGFSHQKYERSEKEACISGFSCLKITNE